MKPRRRHPLCSAGSAGPLHPAGGGDGGHGAGDQHERDRGAGRGAEPHGEVRGQSGSACIKEPHLTSFFSPAAAAGVTVEERTSREVSMTFRVKETQKQTSL